jgi:hypothetical protein
MALARTFPTSGTRINTPQLQYHFNDCVRAGQKKIYRHYLTGKT